MKALIPLLNFSKDIYIMKTLNLKFFKSLKDPVRQTKNCLGFIQKLLED